MENAAAKHTTGPWMQRGKWIYALGSVDTVSFAVLGAIASVEELEASDGDGRTWTADGDALANARLIAAAPDLLELLKRANEAGSHNDDIRSVWWEERAEAIAKATASPSTQPE